MGDLVHSGPKGASIPGIGVADLIVRLESAEAGSRQLDDAVLSAMGWAERRFPMDSIPYWMHPDHPGVALSGAQEVVTTSLGAALALCGRVLPDFTACLVIGGRSPDSATVAGPDFVETFAAHAATPALAMCIAILKACTARDEAVGGVNK